MSGFGIIDDDGHVIALGGLFDQEHGDGATKSSLVFFRTGISKSLMIICSSCKSEKLGFK